ncbi:MAG TPA: hypothetical protein VHE81_14360 [Lacipirellulaceae bacterium]|nr:hypothetical protein [Lacipirellulaceae bacterium]
MVFERRHPAKGARAGTILHGGTFYRIRLEWAAARLGMMLRLTAISR